MLLKNVASQGVYLFAVDTSANPPGGKTGDASNITGAFSLDGAAETVGFTTAHPTEIGGGIYWQPLSQGETNGNMNSYRWVSSTGGIVIDPYIVGTSGVNLPAVAPGGSGGLPTTDSANGVKLSVGTSTGQLDITTGVVKANMTQILGSASVGTAGYVGVDWAQLTNKTTTNALTGTSISTSQTIATVSGNVAGSVGSVTAGVTVTTNNDKTGYSLAVSPPTASAIATAVWTDLLGGGDFVTAFSIGALLNTNINATISSRSDGTSVTLAASQTFNNTGTWTGNLTGSVGTVTALGTTAKTDVENAVWDGLLTSHTTGTTFGGYVQAIGSAVSANDIAATIANGSTLVTGTSSSGSYTNTSTVNSTPWVTAPVTPAVGGFGLRQRLTFNIGVNRAPLSIKIVGHWNGGGQSADVYALNNLTGVYDKLTNTTTHLPNRASDATYVLPVAREYVDGSGITTVEFRSASTNTGHSLSIDQILVYNINEAATFNGLFTTPQQIWTYTGPEGRSLTTQGNDPIVPPSVSEIWGEPLPGAYASGSAGFNLDVAVSTRSTLTATDVWAAGTRSLTDKADFFLDASEHLLVASDVLNATAASYNAAATIGAAINTSGSALDPWTTPLPGGYSAGQAGFILGTFLDVAVSTGGITAADVWSEPVPGAFAPGSAGYVLGTNLDAPITGTSTLTVADIWGEIVPGAYGVGSAGLILGGNLDVAVSSRSTLTANDVWAESLPGAYTINQAGYIIGVNIDASINSRSVLTATNVWEEALPGAYAGGTAGFLLGTNLDGPISGTSTLTVADIWGELVPGVYGAGSAGSALGAAGSAGDPWATPLPGAYSAGQAGYIIGNNLDAPVSAGSTLTAADVWAYVDRQLTDKTGFALASDGVDAISIEAGINLRQAQSAILASGAGVLSGVGTGTITIKDPAGANTRILASSLDGIGNRPTIALYLPA